jgi:hypothetical protein
MGSMLAVTDAIIRVHATDKISLITCVADRCAALHCDAPFFHSFVL